MLYREALRLRSLGLSYRAIARIMGVDRGQLRKWIVRRTPPKYERYTPNLTPSADLSYLIGFYLGDGARSGNQKKVRFKITNKEHLELLSQIIGNILHSSPKQLKYDGHFYIMSYDSAKLYDFLQKPLRQLRTSILGTPNEFLSGLFDAEGSVNPNLNHKKRIFSTVVIGLTNTNIEILEFARSQLKRLHIESKLVPTNKAGQIMKINGHEYVRRNDVYQIRIVNRHSLLGFQKLIGFRMSSKKQKLDDLLKIITENETAKEKYATLVNRYVLVNRRWLRK